MARYQGHWIFVRHQSRTTWEIPGGHREVGEDISTTASRELWEETGAKEFSLVPLCVYSVDRDEDESFGQLFLADVTVLGDLPASEITEVMLFDNMPQDLTYPLIQPFLFQAGSEFVARAG
jgi:8-oxo-dGTP diphosphatase